MDCYTNQRRQRPMNMDQSMGMDAMNSNRDCSCGTPPSSIPMRPQPRQTQQAPTVAMPAMSCKPQPCQVQQPSMPLPPQPRQAQQAPMPMQPQMRQPQQASFNQNSCGCGPITKPCVNTTNNQIGTFPVGMGYVPWQQWAQTYPIDRGFQRGTIFPELDLIFAMGRCR